MVRTGALDASVPPNQAKILAVVMASLSSSRKK